MAKKASKKESVSEKAVSEKVKVDSFSTHFFVKDTGVLNRITGYDTADNRIHGANAGNDLEQWFPLSHVTMGVFNAEK